MDEDLYKQIYGGAIKNIASLQELEEAEEEQRLAEEAAQQAQQEAEEKKKKEEEDKKGLLQKVGEGAADLGSKIGAGIQQGLGKVADTAIQGGAVLDEVANQIKGGTEEEKNARHVKNLEGTEKLREWLHSQKDIRGEEISGTKGAEEAASKIASGNGDIKDFARVAGEGLDVGLSATQFANPTSLLRGGAKATAGSSIARGAAGEAVEVTVKDAAKVAAKDAALFGTLDAAQGTATTYGDTGDMGQALEQGAQQGLLSAATQGALNVGGYAAGRTISRIKNGPDAPKVDDATVKTDAEPTTPDSGTQFSKIDDDELARQIEQFQAGERTGDTTADYARYQELRDEAQFRVDQKDKADFEANGLPNDVEGARKALEDFDSGSMPDTVYKPREANVQSVAELFADQDMPKEIRGAAQEVMDDLGKVNTMLDGLMNDQKYETSHIEMDQAYNARLREIQQMPEPRYVAERQKLDAQYKDDLAELEMIREKDLPEVEQYNQMQDMLEAREQQIVGDVNLLIENNPSTFRVPDEAEVAAQRQALADNLEQAERFNEPSRVVEQVANASDPVKAFDRNPDAQVAMQKEVVKEIESLPNTEVVQKNFKNISGMSLAALRAMSPSQVLEKMGLRNTEINMFQDILRAESTVNRVNKANSKVLEAINAKLPDSPDAQRQIIDYLQGDRKTLTAFDKESADMIRGLLDEKRAELESLGFKTLDDYFPHIFDKKDPEVQRLFKGKTTGEISFANLKSRIANSDEYSRDIMDVLTTYVSGVNRKMYLEPAIKPLADLRTQVKLQDAEAKWVDGYVEQLMGFDKSAVGDSFNTFMDGVLKKVGLESAVGKNHYTATLGTQRMVSAVATMGLNPGTAIRNMTQMVNTVADIGPRYSTIGAVDGMRMLATANGRAELQRVGILEGGVSQNYFDAITKTGVRGRITKTRDAATKGMMSLIHVTDVTLRAQAYAGAKALGIKKGLSGDVLEKFAADHVVDTQFITSRVDMPLAFNGQGVRSLTQLATFSGKQAGFLKRTGVKMIKDADGNFKLDPKAMGSVLSAVIVAGAATEALKPLLGFRESEWIPFYDQVAPFAGAITGQEVEGGDSLYRSPLVRLLAGDGKSKSGLIQALQNGDLEEFWNDNWSQIVPAGTQIKKSTEGYSTTTSGESRNASGNIRYLQDMDQDSVLNATVFGQYSTEAGRNWIEEGFPTLSESQTAKVDEQKTREAKEQYADFYVAIKKAGGRQAAYDEVKNAAVLGDQNKARRIADEYNQTVYDALSDYYTKHDELPSKLEEELTSRILINANRAAKNARN